MNIFIKWNSLTTSTYFFSRGCRVTFPSFFFFFFLRRTCDPIFSVPNNRRMTHRLINERRSSSDKQYEWMELRPFCCELWLNAWLNRGFRTILLFFLHFTIPLFLSKAIKRQVWYRVRVSRACGHPTKCLTEVVRVWMGGWISYILRSIVMLSTEILCLIYISLFYSGLKPIRPFQHPLKSNGVWVTRSQYWRKLKYQNVFLLHHHRQRDSFIHLLFFLSYVTAIKLVEHSNAIYYRWSCRLNFSWYFIHRSMPQANAINLHSYVQMVNWPLWGFIHNDKPSDDIRNHNTLKVQRSCNYLDTIQTTS